MGKYDHFRYRKGKDDDLLEAVKQDVLQNKLDFADIARAALRQYYGLPNAGAVGIIRRPAAQAEPQPASGFARITQEPEQRPKNSGVLGGGLKGIKLQRKEYDEEIDQEDSDDLENRLDGLLRED